MTMALVDIGCYVSQLAWLPMEFRAILLGIASANLFAVLVVEVSPAIYQPILVLTFTYSSR